MKSKLVPKTPNKFLRQFALVAAILTVIVASFFGVYKITHQSAEASLPQGVQSLKTQLETFSTLRISLTQRQPFNDISPDFPEKIVIHANQTGQLAWDRLQPRPQRYTWNLQEGIVRWDYMDDSAPPKRRAEYEPAIQEVWNYIRSGESYWFESDPLDYGITVSSNIGWFEIELPFTWTQGVHLFIHMQYADTIPYQLAYFLEGEDELHVFTISLIEYNPSLPSMAFDPNIPPHGMEIPFPDEEGVVK